jgi:isopenicillin N synthase-like dioxygenase
VAFDAAPCWQFTSHSSDALRVINYERAAGEPSAAAGQLGMGEHTDYGICTLLYADAVPGLQVTQLRELAASRARPG